MFLALLAMPIVRKLASVLLVVAALGAIAHSIYHAGAHAGAAAESSHQVAANQTVFERLEASTHQRLDAADAHERELASLIERLSAQATAASSLAVAAESAAASDRARIASLSDAAIRSDLQRQLGLAKKPAAAKNASPDSLHNAAPESSLSATPDVSLDEALKDPATLRQLDARLADCAHLGEKTAALEQQVSALAAESAARNSQLTTVAAERDTALDSYNQLVPLYTQAFNAATQRHRRWFCLFLCRTGPHLNLPAPVILPARHNSAGSPTT